MRLFLPAQRMGLYERDSHRLHRRSRSDVVFGLRPGKLIYLFYIFLFI